MRLTDLQTTVRDSAPTDWHHLPADGDTRADPDRDGGHGDRSRAVLRKDVEVTLAWREASWTAEPEGWVREVAPGEDGAVPMTLELLYRGSVADRLSGIRLGDGTLAPLPHMSLPRGGSELQRVVHAGDRDAWRLVGALEGREPEILDTAIERLGLGVVDDVVPDEDDLPDPEDSSGSDEASDTGETSETDETSDADEAS